MARTNQGSKLSSVLAAKAWNELPIEIRLAPTLTKFRIHAKNYYIETYK